MEAEGKNQEKTALSQFPRSAEPPRQSPKYWVKEKDRYLRQLLIGDIEAVTGRPLFVYFAQLDQSINHTDPDDLAEILSDTDGKTADILIQTPEGIVDAAEKLICILKGKFDSYNVIIPSWAKSAGTVIALSSNKIMLGLNSEMGPIDPHFGSFPCELIAEDDSQPHCVRKQAELAVERMRHLAKTILKKGMMAGKGEQEIEKILNKISSAQGYKSHGAVIDYSEAKNLGFSVTFLEPESVLWKHIWLLYCMYDFDTKANDIGRIIEGKKLSIARPA